MILYVFYMESGIEESNVITYSFYIFVCLLLYFLSYSFLNNWELTKPKND